MNGTSGDEDRVREFIVDKIKNKCEYKIDALGSVIAFKRGKKRPANKVMICAHMDEVGFIVTSVTDDGYLKFSPVGGIEADCVLTRRLNVNGKIGVAG